jgi:hypothetical protein
LDGIDVIIPAAQKEFSTMKTFIAVLLICFVSTSGFGATSPWGNIEKLFNKKGIERGDLFKITFPRTDLEVTMNDLVLSPDLALTSWLAFKRAGKATIMMGEIVLKESEIGRVEYKLDSAGIEITGLHNHLIGESPKIMYMHVSGHGDALSLAEVVKSIFSVTGTPMGETSSPSGKNFDWSSVDTIIGAKGTKKGSVIQYSIPRPGKITQNGMEISPFMGTASSINFQNDETKTAVTGDFVLLANEIAPVIHTLISYSITVTGVHNFMLDESPKTYFLHFWGYDDPTHLADGIKAALNEVGKETKAEKKKDNLK